MKYMYLVSKQWSSEGPEQYETWEVLPRPKVPSLFWTEDDQYHQMDKITGARLKDVIAKLSALHPGMNYTKKFDRYGEPEWVITFFSEDEKVILC
jgi:hypothetical protein